MDQNVNEYDGCTRYIYSEEYLNLLIRYDNKFGGIYEFISPDCTTIIDNFYLVAYKREFPGMFDNIYAYGYSSIPKCYGLMDQSVLAATGADKVRIFPGLQLNGQDTLIGFVDTGIDYMNPLFRNLDGSTRIEAIWDQNENVLGTSNKIFGYGAEYTRKQINSAIESINPYDIVPSKDENGHGTFLASVAAGNINGANQFSGIAPSCGIVVVKLKQAKNNLRDYYYINDEAICYGEDDIILGIKYLVTTAIRLGKPMVICLGLGTNQGDHEGNNVLELFLDTISNVRGISTVVAGGNELGSGAHFTNNAKYVFAEDSNIMEINVGENDKGFSMELWGNAPSLLNVSIKSPTGELYSGIIPQRNGRSTVDFLFEGSKVYIDNVVVEPLSGDQLLFFRFENPARGVWILEVTENFNINNRGYDAWLPIDAFRNSSTSFLQSNPNVTLCAPSNSKGTITVSGFNHNNDSIYINSSRGYTRKNRIKPDICAPSVDVLGVFATNNAKARESLFIRKNGTSVGAAVAAGAISLILEWAIVRGNNPIINNETIKQMLIRGSRKITGISYPNPEWGWGALDILGVFEAMRTM